MATYPRRRNIWSITWNKRREEEKKQNLFDFSTSQPTQLSPQAKSWLAWLKFTEDDISTPSAPVIWAGTVSQPTWTEPDTSGIREAVLSQRWLTSQPTQPQEQTPITIDNYFEDPEISKEWKRKMIADLSSWVLSEQDANEIVREIYATKQEKPFEAPWFFEWIWEQWVWALEKTWEAFESWLNRVLDAFEQESWWDVVEFWANIMQWVSWVLEAWFSPVIWLIWQWIESVGKDAVIWWFNLLPEDIQENIKTWTREAMLDAVYWYDRQPKRTKDLLRGAWFTADVWSYLLWLKWWEIIWKEVTEQVSKSTLWDLWKGVIDKTKNQLKDIKIPNIKGATSKASDVIDEWVEKAALKLTWSEDWSKELFKATSPSYNTLSKNKDITKIVESAKKADEAVVKRWLKPKTTSERVNAYNKTMKQIWKDVENIRSDVTTEFDANKMADEIEDGIANLSVWWEINPAIRSDINALQAQADYFRKIWNVDIPTLWNQRTLINAITDWGATTEYWNTFSNIMKKVWQSIRQAEDEIISNAWKWKTADLLREYGALRNMYDDIVKQDIKNLRAKWMWIEESFSRIAWISEALWWIAQLFTNPKRAIPSFVSWWSKVLLWKTAAKLRDPDFLIKTWYNKLLKSIKKPKNLPKNK